MRARPYTIASVNARLVQLRKWNTYGLSAFVGACVLFASIIAGCDKVAEPVEIPSTRAEALAESGQYVEAEQASRNAVATARAAGKEARAELVKSLTILGYTQFKQSRLDEAEKTLREALEVEEARGTTDTSLLWKVLVNLGGVYRAAKKHDNANECFERALALAGSDTNASAVMRATVLANAAANRAESGAATLREVRPLLQEAATLLRAASETDLPLYGSVLLSLGSAEMQSRDFASAASTFRKALDVYERSRGPDHPETGLCHQYIGISLQGLGELEQAEQHLERALAIREGALGKEDPSVQKMMAYLVDFYRRAKNDEKANALAARLATPDRDSR